MMAFFERVDAMPDSIVIVLIGLAIFGIVGLMDVRSRARRARWVPPAARSKQ